MTLHLLEFIGILFGSAGFGGLCSAVLQNRLAAKKIPAETDSIIVTGAETAVVALQAVLTAETARADRAEARVSLLEEKLDTAQRALDEVRAELHAITIEISSRKDAS